jgi:hypothetical protein
MALFGSKLVLERLFNAAAFGFETRDCDIRITMLVPKERIELSQGVTSADFESAASTVPPLRPEVNANYSKKISNVSGIRRYRDKESSFYVDTNHCPAARRWRSRSLPPDKYAGK